jgi:outer membrane DcaP-like protein
MRWETIDGTMLRQFILVWIAASGLLRSALGQAASPPQPLASPAALSAPAATTAKPSLVFPDGFPTISSAENHGVIAGASIGHEADDRYAELQPADSAYPTPNHFPHEVDDSAGMVSYSVFSDPLPDYYYHADYYYEAGIGARPLADYAPVGYEPREEQDAPGVPEFTPLSPPVRVTPDERQSFVTRGIVPGSFLAPGSNTSIRLRGFVRLTALEDLDPIGSADSFVPNTIPVPQSDGQNFNMTGRISRFGIESWTPTNFREWNVHTFIEGDFFNGPAQAAGGGGNPFRLRHAFVDFGYFRVGQQNTAFMDGTNWPSLVDFQGPNGWINQRQPSARMTIPIGDSFFWAAGVDRPFSDITTNGLGTNVQEVPDFATHLRYETTVGHLQVSGLMRTIGYQPTGDEVVQHTGAGISGSAVFHPWAIMMGTDPVHEANPSGLTRSRILLQGTWGSGISRYINDMAGQGLDGQVNPITGDFDLVTATGWNASYENWFNESWLSNFTYSQVVADNNADQPGTTYERGQYLAASVWWIPVTRMSLGIEYLWGQRKNLDGQSSDANRVNALFQYNF